MADQPTKGARPQFGKEVPAPKQANHKDLILRLLAAAAFSIAPVSTAVPNERFDWVEFYFDKQPNTPHQLNDHVSFGAELEIDTEGEFNLNLDSDDDEDEIITKPDIQIAVLYDNDNWLRAYLEVEFTRDLVVRSPDNGPVDPKLEVKEAYFNLFGDDRNSALTVGRWRWSDEREWLVDEDMDGAQFAWRGKHLAFEVIYAREQLLTKDLLGTQDRDEPDHFYARFYGRPSDNTLASIYALYQHHRMARSDHLLWIGGSIFGDCACGIDYWLEGAGVFGIERSRNVSGFGFDAGLTKTFEAVPMQPRITAAVAFGSGDNGVGTDTAFRQTGIQGNTDRFGGRKSFKYYGEVFDPELSNLGVLTLGTGINLSEKTTLDIVYHHYFQQRAADDIRDSALDTDPSGNSRHIGDEVDIIIGFRELEMIDIDIVAGVFVPGAAFVSMNDPAYFGGLEFKRMF